MKGLHIVAYLLLFIGGLNWGLVGLFNFNLVWSIFGAWPMLVNFIYILVGAATVYVIIQHKTDCKCCAMPVKVSKSKKK